MRLSQHHEKLDDPRIAWHMRECSRRYNVDVSELAVRLALDAHTRGNQDATHDWEAHNAISFQRVLAANPPNAALSEVADKRRPD